MKKKWKKRGGGALGRKSGLKWSGSSPVSSVVFSWGGKGASTALRRWRGGRAATVTYHAHSLLHHLGKLSGGKGVGETSSACNRRIWRRGKRHYRLNNKVANSPYGTIHHAGNKHIKEKKKGGKSLLLKVYQSYAVNGWLPYGVHVNNSRKEGREGGGSANCISKGRKPFFQCGTKLSSRTSSSRKKKEKEKKR